jgi:hypothetical protein
MMPKVYVDALVNWPVTKKWRHGKACHLMIDPETPIEKLHEFAEWIGLKRSWFQVSASGLPHYDLTELKRAKAVKHGAIEVDRRATVGIIQAWRVKEILEREQAEFLRICHPDWLPKNPQVSAATSEPKVGEP